MDSISTQLPTLTPLAKSFTVDKVEDELKQMFIDLFDTYLALSVHDANTMGMAHLGSFDLVRKMVNTDGLILLNSQENPSTRRLYRAWKAGHLQGRGTYFLETFLQLLFPGSWAVDQQMQLSTGTYPNELFSFKTHGSDTDKYLTSRLRIQLASQSSNVAQINNIIPVLRAVIPARLVPEVTTVDAATSNMRITSAVTPVQYLNTSGAAI